MLHKFMVLIGFCVYSFAVTASIDDQLLIAIFENSLVEVNRLLSQGANVNYAHSYNGWTPLIYAAVYSSDIQITRSLVERGANIEATDHDGRTPLMKAAYKGNAEIVCLLLDLGAKINAQDVNGYTSLIHATLNNHTKVAHLLIERGADVNIRNSKKFGEWDPLMFALANENIEVAKKLIEYGAGNDDFDYTTWIKNLPGPKISENLVKLLDTKNIREAILCLKIEQPHNSPVVNTVSRKTHQSPRVNSCQTALIENDLIAAIVDNDAAKVRFCLEQGADANNKRLFGWTPLISAAVHSHDILIARLLIAYNAKINERTNDGETALMKAAYADFVELIHLLLDQDADINARDNKGYTALLYALIFNHTKAALALIERGADVTSATNSENWTPLMFALVAENIEVAKKLVECGAGNDDFDYGTWIKNLPGPKISENLVKLLDTKNIREAIHSLNIEQFHNSPVIKTVRQEASQPPTVNARQIVFDLLTRLS